MSVHRDRLTGKEQDEVLEQQRTNSSDVVGRRVVEIEPTDLGTEHSAQWLDRHAGHRTPPSLVTVLAAL